MSPDSLGSLFGTYGGVVEDCKDPMRLGRLKVRVPAVYGQPRVATAAQTALVGQAINATSATAAGTAAATGTTVLPTPGGTNSNSYKVQIIKVMVQKAVLATA